MYYIERRNNNSIFVTDTKDSVTEELTLEQYNNFLSNGISIGDWFEAAKYITESMNCGCNYKFYNKLKRYCDEYNLKEYLSDNAVFTLTNFLVKSGLSIDLNGEFKVYNYSETHGFIACSIPLSDNSRVILKVNELNKAGVVHIDSGYITKMYPCCRGYMTMRVLNISGLSLDSNEIYLSLYNDFIGKICIVNLSRLIGEESIIYI